MVVNLIILFCLIILSAFFSSAEVAFLSLTDVKVDTMIKRNLPKARTIQDLKRNPRHLLITILIGNNVVNIASASLATVVMSNFFDSAVIGITTGIMTLLVLIFGEIIPKSYATNHPKRFAIFSAVILKVLQTILYPVIKIFEWLTNIFAGKQKPEKTSEEEIQALTERGERQGVIETNEHKLIKRLFKLNDTTIKNIMTPKTRMVLINSSMPISQATEIIEHHSFSRYPVYKDSPDNIIGYIHSRDVLLVHHREREDASVEEIVRPIIFVKQYDIVDDVLAVFQKETIHMAMVTNKTKHIVGMVTLEDVLEELVGEIGDEYDEE